MTNWIADAESGASVRAKLNGLANNGGITEISSGASPVDADITKQFTAVTSDGTAGDQIVNIPNPAPVLDGYSTPLLFGMRHVVYLETQADPDDVVKVRINGGEELNVYDRIGNSFARAVDDVAVLDYVGSIAVFVWLGYVWGLDQSAGDNSTDFTALNTYAPPFGAGIAPGVTGGVPLVWGGAGPQYKADAGCVNGVQLLTTGASPVQSDPNTHCTRITSGGTAGTETVTFNAIPLNEAGAEHVFRLVGQTDPADVVSIDPTHIKTSADAEIASIHLLAVDDLLHVKMSILGWWRVVETTATVTPA